jgi:hypothetical protein
MWKLVAAAVLAGAAALAAVVIVGLRVLDEDAEALPRAPEPTWAERANAVCTDAVAEVFAAVAATPPGTEAADRQVQLYLSTTEVEGRLVSGLRDIAPPRGRAAEVEAAVGALERQYDQDVVVADLLQERYDRTLVVQALTAYEREAKRLRALFRELGADDCVRYLDPATYR